MPVKKTIAIIGATEKKGIEITTQFAQSDFRLLLVSNDISKLAQLSKKITDSKPRAEIDSIECVKDGCWEADIIILAVPFCEEKEVAKMMKEVATQKIVVDFSNEENAGSELCSILPYTKLVEISGNFTSKEILISGNDEAANKEISEIFIQAGYRTAALNNTSANK